MLTDQSFYPTYLNDIDRAAVSAQRWRFWVLRTQIAALAIVAIAGTLPASWGFGGLAYYLTATIGMALAVIVLGIELRCRFEDKWFVRRALAENLKQMAWDYSVGRFGARGKVSLDEFALAFKELEEKLRRHVGRIGVARTSAELITDEMNNILSQDWTERFDHYKSMRLTDQIKWYSERSSRNSKAASVAEAVTVSAEGVGLLLVIIEWGVLSSVHFSAIAAIMCTGVVTWTIARKYKDLAVTYEIAASDLNTLQMQGAAVDSEAEFLAWSGAVEEAISREHHVWLARSGREWINN